MKTIEIECFEVWQPSGDGMRDEHICYASTELVANLVAKHLGTGWPHYVKKFTKLFTICESLEDYTNNTTQALRKSAASKLTAAERSVLNIDKEGRHVL